METSEVFKGVLTPSKNSHQPGLALVYRLAKDNPYFQKAVQIMKLGGVREHRAPSIEKDRDTEQLKVVERSFRIMSEHGLVVALAADSLAELLGLNPEDRQDLVAAAIIHDATKPIEVVMMNFRTLQHQGKVSGHEKATLEKTLERAGILGWKSLAQVIKDLHKLGTLEFGEYFDREINEPFLKKTLSGFEPEKGAKLIEISSCDSVSALPKVIALARHFRQDSGKLEEDKVEADFRSIAESLRERAKLSEIEGSKTEYLAMMLWYCDSIVTANFITTLNQRRQEAEQRGAYSELDNLSRKLYDGRTFWETWYVTNNIIERNLTAKGKVQGTIRPSVRSEELPSIIFQNLEKRVSIK